MRSDDSAIRFDIVPWFHGRVLDISEGSSKAFPHFISHIEVGIDDPCNLSIFADSTMNGVLSSGLLHLLATESVTLALKEWMRVTRSGGHLMLHIPTKVEKAKWDVSYEAVLSLMHEAGSWDLVEYQRREDGWLLFVFRKVLDLGVHALSHQNDKPIKTCAVVRLGAFGDNIQASSILPWLKEQGYHITFYTSDYGYPVIEHDPHIDRFIIQGRDEVPPQYLGAFWKHEEKKYDKWINLSGSVEGTLLAAPGTERFDWPNEVRAKLMDVNYLEFTHEIAGVPPPYRPKFYSTPAEREWARFQKRNFGRRNILWSLSGSAFHKSWPHLDAIIARVMLGLPHVHIVLVGDEACQILEAGWQKEKRVHLRSGKWSIRQSMAFAEVADLIIGCETGLLNASGSMDTPKIVLLSHSSEKMLTKHWTNVTAISQGGIGCPMQPCRLLHQSKDTCHVYEDENVIAAQCMQHIGIEQVWGAVVRVLGQERMVA